MFGMGRAGAQDLGGLARKKRRRDVGHVEGPGTRRSASDQQLVPLPGIPDGSMIAAARREGRRHDAAGAGSYRTNPPHPFSAWRAILPRCCCRLRVSIRSEIPDTTAPIAGSTVSMTTRRRGGRADIAGPEIGGKFTKIGTWTRLGPIAGPAPAAAPFAAQVDPRVCIAGLGGTLTRWAKPPTTSRRDMPKPVQWSRSSPQGPPRLRCRSAPARRTSRPPTRTRPSSPVRIRSRIGGAIAIASIETPHDPILHSVTASGVGPHLRRRSPRQARGRRASRGRHAGSAGGCR